MIKKEKILFLGSPDSPLIEWLRDKGEEVIQTSAKLSIEYIQKEGFTFLISYGYRHILTKDILKLFQNSSINLHISYLPWNRGADPNLWSFIENSPKGVTIHYIDEGVDTGDIIAQKEITFDSRKETLASTYDKLQSEIQQLFKTNWQKIKTGRCNRTKQAGDGSIHKIKDKERLTHLLTNGWNTPIDVLESYASNQGET